MMKRMSNKKRTCRRCVAVTVLLALLLVSFLSCSKQEKNSGTRDMQTVSEGENLVIPISELSGTAQFYPVTVNGTAMEIIAVKDSSGTVRTAFNTCQICFDSGRGYYKQTGNLLVCQNCGNSFTMEQIEVSIGGCNPYPIFASDKTVTEDSILISYDFLEASRRIFLNWKSNR